MGLLRGFPGRSVTCIPPVALCMTEGTFLGPGPGEERAQVRFHDGPCRSVKVKIKLIPQHRRSGPALDPEVGAEAGAGLHGPRAPC